MKYDGLLFDLDGTLWNSMNGVLEAFKKVLADYENVDIVTEKKMNEMMGLPMDEIGKRLFPRVSDDIKTKIMEDFCKAEQKILSEKGGILFPNLEETLRVLCNDHKLFIVSNCQDGYIQAFLHAHKLNKYFTDFESWGKTGLSKGENNLLIMKRNNIQQGIYIGDTIKDLESARYAKIPFVYASYGFGEVKEYDYKIKAFNELLNYF